MTIGIIIIGDEIMSGKRADRHLSATIEILKKRGMQLNWAEYVGDDPERITAILKRTFLTNDIVFSCGGIGATPDDHTRQCAANALGVSLILHPEAKEKIQERISDIALEKGYSVDFQTPDNLQRLKMGEFPEGSKIIPNPINKIPGFSVGTHYFFPGFPEMAHPMIEWVLETYYQTDFYKIDYLEKSLIIYDAAESRLTPLMETIEQNFPQIKVFSLPFIGKDGSRSYIELGVKGKHHETEIAFSELQKGLQLMGMEYRMNA